MARQLRPHTLQAIIKAILGGARDPHELAAFRNPRVKASEEEIAQSLEGHWQPDLLFVLKQEQDGYEFCQRQIAQCDRQPEHYLLQRDDRATVHLFRKKSGKYDLRKRTGISRSSTCGGSCFA